MPKATPQSLRFLSAALAGGFLAALASTGLRGHDVPTSSVDFNRDLLPILQARCVSCHREGGSAFSLETYAAARPWAKAIEEEVLARRMPPWNAVPGFAEFCNDPSLTMKKRQQFAEWAEGGAPEGDPVEPASPVPHGAAPPAAAPRLSETPVSGGSPLSAALELAGLRLLQVDEGASFRLTAVLPDGQMVPLIWIDQFQPAAGRDFLYREPVVLPAGTIIEGLPPNARVGLLTASG